MDSENLTLIIVSLIARGREGSGDFGTMTRFEHYFFLVSSLSQRQDNTSLDFSTNLYPYVSQVKCNPIFTSLRSEESK